MNKTNVVAVVGPTASGKTALGIELSKRLNGEVVSCDSMQIYKGMAIATAKPTEEEMQGISHHLIDFVEPTQRYSVAKYVDLATATILDIKARGKTPIIVGGTGLYVDSLINGISFATQEKEQDTAIRDFYCKMAEEQGNLAVYAVLEKIDPEYAKTLHPNNLWRVVRAIEHYKLTNTTMSQQLIKSKEKPSNFNCCYVGITFRDRAKLYDKINHRVDVMLEMGILEEVREFYKNYSPNTAAQAIGAKEFLPYLNGEKPLEECIATLKQETRRYAKRQLTWFNRNTAVNWIFREDYLNEQELFSYGETVVKKWLEEN